MTDQEVAISEYSARVINVEDSNLVLSEFIVPVCKTLAKDINIVITYEPRIVSESKNQLLIVMLISNVSNCTLKDVEISIIETVNISIVKENDEINSKLPPIILPGSTSEYHVTLAVDNIALNQTVRGSFTYIVKDTSSTSHEKLDFKLHVPASTFMVGEIHPRDTRDTFTELLSSNDLSARDSIMIDVQHHDFRHVLAKICFHCHFFVVEQYGISASLYSHSIQDDHVCLLVKLVKPHHIAVEAKGSNSALITCLLEEIKCLFCKTEDTQ
ncbi:AP-3 complex subunit delta-1 [Trichonephila clavipes]|nr:AP-3 complex subunit delta-1 [Trichonephila clavipes]